MYQIKVLLILLLLIIARGHPKKEEGFSSKQEIKQKSKEIFANKNMFYPGAKYSKIKSNMPWIDPVIYDDVYKLALNKNLSISNLENTLYNSIN